MLVLPIKKKWFDMIISGEKREEYREFKQYYHSRIGYLTRGNQIIKVMFRNGQKYNSPAVICRCTVTVGKGIEKWGAIPDTNYYILKIIEILEVKNE